MRKLSIISLCVLSFLSVNAYASNSDQSDSSERISERLERDREFERNLKNYEKYAQKYYKDTNGGYSNEDLARMSGMAKIEVDKLISEMNKKLEEQQASLASSNNLAISNAKNDVALAEYLGVDIDVLRNLDNYEKIIELLEAKQKSATDTHTSAMLQLEKENITNSYVNQLFKKEDDARNLAFLEEQIYLARDSLDPKIRQVVEAMKEDRKAILDRMKANYDANALRQMQQVENERLKATNTQSTSQQVAETAKSSTTAKNQQNTVETKTKTLSPSTGSNPTANQLY